MTAPELKINKQRSYATIADNQAALERCLRDVIHAMDIYATLYQLAPMGDYEVSFEWDDSIITDRPNSFIGDGGTVAIRQFEKATGLNCGRNGNNHAQKIEDLKAFASRLLLNNLPENDKLFLEDMLEKLKEVSDNDV